MKTPKGKDRDIEAMVTIQTNGYNCGDKCSFLDLEDKMMIPRCVLYDQHITYRIRCLDCMFGSGDIEYTDTYYDNKPEEEEEETNDNTN